MIREYHVTYTQNGVTGTWITRSEDAIVGRLIGLQDGTDISIKIVDIKI